MTARPQPILADPAPVAWSVARTHVGVVRALNEDAHLDNARVGLWAVADGMGGHHAGDVASRATIESLAAIPAAASGYALLGAVQDALQQTNRRLLAQASLIGPGAIIGSTVVALLIRDGHFACLWAGDSRAYRWRDHRLEVVTHDHSVAQEMIDRGEITPEAARSHAHSNLITRALGVTEPLQPDSHPRRDRARRPLPALLGRIDRRGHRRGDRRDTGRPCPGRRRRRPRRACARARREGQSHPGAGAAEVRRRLAWKATWTSSPGFASCTITAAPCRRATAATSARPRPLPGVERLRSRR